MAKNRFEIKGKEGNYTVTHLGANNKVFSSNSKLNTLTIAYKHIIDELNSIYKMSGLLMRAYKTPKKWEIYASTEKGFELVIIEVVDLTKAVKKK